MTDDQLFPGGAWVAAFGMLAIGVAVRFAGVFGSYAAASLLGGLGVSLAALLVMSDLLVGLFQVAVRLSAVVGILKPPRRPL
jgi:hypothetical protein